MASASSEKTAVLASRLHGFEAPTVWHEFSPLAAEHKAINLGQGFPTDSPAFVLEAIKTAVDAGHNQYARSAGAPPLMKCLARRYSARLGREINWETEVTATVGASEALFALMQSLLNPGDEVVTLEPAFDLYPAQVKMAGGVIKRVPLRQRTDEATGKQTFYVDIDEFAAAFTPRTKVFLLNNPHNPCGRVFTREELQAFADVVRAQPHHVTVVSDEVYEHLTYDGHEHIHIASLPGMWDHVATVSSSGKTFSVTGWKVGWVVGPPSIVKGVMIANQWVQFSVPTPTQYGVAAAFERAEQEYEGFPTFFDWLKAQYHKRRDVLLKGLEAAGLNPITPEGSFFVMADTSKLTVPEKYLAQTTPAAPVMTRDWAFCRWLTIEHGVSCIPPSAFYSDETKALAANTARFAFCKTDDQIAAAAAKLTAISASSDASSGGSDGTA